MRYRFVEQEVERVKVLFDQKEGRLRSERDAAQRQVKQFQAQQEDWEAQVRGFLNDAAPTTDVPQCSRSQEQRTAPKPPPHTQGTPAYR